MHIFIIFPHQLFENLTPLLSSVEVWLMEEYLFFRQYRFHKQKIALHRYTMKAYEAKLKALGCVVHYVESRDKKSDIRVLLPHLASSGVKKITFYDVVDNWLNKRIQEGITCTEIESVCLPSPLFINTTEELEAYGRRKKHYYQTDFYIYQRKHRNILLDDHQQPLGGQWTFDADNRKKYPSGKKPPKAPTTEWTDFHSEAWEYTNKYFDDHVGLLDTTVFYPHDTDSARLWFQDFLQNRFEEFGPYEDAIVAGENILHHSVLTPVLNTGLITPGWVIEESIRYADQNDIPISSLEGFVRQILGWREFIRWIYQKEEVFQRTHNFWGFDRPVPASFYDGTTGIKPVDDTIRMVLKTGYNHHIERLMILSNVMLLCEFDPDHVYQWFMEMYVDAYDWVMVPNVYGMGQFSDGGLMCTKPYISGSNYIFKMSDYKKGEEWAHIWDALFWRFMDVHRSFFMRNPRLGMLVATFDKWEEDKKQRVHKTAEDFLHRL